MISEKLNEEIEASLESVVRIRKEKFKITGLNSALRRVWGLGEIRASGVRNELERSTSWAYLNSPNCREKSLKIQVRRMVQYLRFLEVSLSEAREIFTPLNKINSRVCLEFKDSLDDVYEVHRCGLDSYNGLPEDFLW